MCDRVYLWVVCHEGTREREGKRQRKGNINLNVSSVFKHARVSRRDNHFAIHNFFLMFIVDDSSSCITSTHVFLSISITFITLEGGFGHNTMIK